MRLKKRQKKEDEKTKQREVKLKVKEPVTIAAPVVADKNEESSAGLMMDTESQVSMIT